MKNELMLIDKIESRLKAKREPIVFPLTPTHRKELRELRDTNVGNLIDRMRTLKQLKSEEYLKKYGKQIQKELDYKKKICNLLNDDWKKRVDKINKVISERKILEGKHDLKFLDIYTDYNNISKLKSLEQFERKISFDIERVTKQISDEEFEKKFGITFDDVQKKIDDVTTKYEEAINFGDLEIVKELYYIMKTADSFFEKVSKIEV